MRTSEVVTAVSSGAARRRAWTVLVGGVVVGGAVLAALLRYTGTASTTVLPGVTGPGPVTMWGLPAARLATQVAAVATVGLLLAAVLFSPRGQRGGLSVSAYRRVRAAAVAAAVWCLCTVALLALTLSDLLAVPVGRAVSVASVTSFAVSVPVGRALALSALVAAAVAVQCVLTWSRGGARVGLGLAVVAVVPPVFTGHAAAAANHQLAVSGLLLHVLPVTVWAGGLLALAVSHRVAVGELAVAVRRFSPLAGWCLAAVAVSGLLSAWVRLGGVAALTTSRYGHLVLLKSAALATIAVVGWWQRRRALPALAAGDRAVFRRLATVEVLLFGAALGVAVALSRSAPPPGGEEDAATALLGYPMPAPLSAGTLAGAWLPEPLLLTATVAAAGLYLSGVWRLHRRGDRWPPGRTAAFLAGCAVIVVATSSGIARYGPVLFSVHMVQHLLLTMIAPILLVLAGPVTLALRALPAAADAAWPGPREAVQAVLHSRPARLLSHPLVALALYVGSLYAMYFTGLYELALRSHAAHLAMLVHFLAVGCLFFWVVIGIDPAPRRPPHPLRMLLVAVSMVLHAIFGVALMQSGTPLAADWFTELDRPWGPGPLAEQRTAGGIAWSFGEAPALLVVLALLVQWAHADEREARRRDRAIDRAEAEGREDAELAAYNAMLAELAARDAGRRQ